MFHVKLFRVVSLMRVCFRPDYYNVNQRAGLNWAPGQPCALIVSFPPASLAFVAPPIRSKKIIRMDGDSRAAGL